MRRARRSARRSSQISAEPVAAVASSGCAPWTQGSPPASFTTLLETWRAEGSLVSTWHERHNGDFAARCACGRRTSQDVLTPIPETRRWAHCPALLLTRLARYATIRAAARRVRPPLAREINALLGAEREPLLTIAAGQYCIGRHLGRSLCGSGIGSPTGPIVACEGLRLVEALRDSGTCQRQYHRTPRRGHVQLQPPPARRSRLVRMS
jgi:hypothetical protein